MNLYLRSIKRGLVLSSVRVPMNAFSSKSVENAIIKNLTEALRPTHLEVVNESYKHNVPKGAESHFKVLVVSELFEDKRPLDRHRMVNQALAELLKPLGGGPGELGGGIHALSIQAKTSAQHLIGDAQMHSTPVCLGGSKA
jgi:stress-induced morphogen